MAICEILTIPDTRLKKISSPVPEVNDGIREIMQDMQDSLYNANGIGLAAIQIGVALRIILIDLEKGKHGEGGNPLFFINPEIVNASEEMASYREGCLSAPDLYEDVERPAFCSVRYLDEQGVAQEMECDELMATCIQHEMDHLEGIMFIDHLSELKRERLLKKHEKRKQQKAVADGNII
ncbi:MAG: peptide deformylase [Parvibaculales bacterium]